MEKIALPLFFLTLISCSTSTPMKSDFEYTKIEQIPDSIQIQNITVRNLFKYQILAHQSSVFDSTMIEKNVYKPHQKLWDSCYGVIFGNENGKKFNHSAGMIEWNRTLLTANKQDLIKRTKIITDINLSKLMTKNLTRFSKLVPYQPTAKLSLLFTPITGIGFGGCNAEQFALEINNPGVDIEYTLTKGLPHEFNHLVYEKFRNADPDKESALSQTIDEGFACYFTYVFFDKKITQHEAVENMSQQQWDWYVKNEKEIFNKVKDFFSDTSGDNPLLRNDKIKLFPDAPKTLNYWLGFRIITKYVEKHGKDSWKDLYIMPAKEVFSKSGYEDYIKGL
ncbi:Predicted Zn-dependent protease [Chryseobacterium balustinum]|uniref:Gliding motility-associated lipoprotein GldB n=2 Tax=Chryseobacterium balustinum TaxID=246 RepID=A0AAX2IRA2_9FLAO|nr:Predicted Zn-dependent protease [Chryseobacterium balustinum]SQA92751.1 gliding motility-associated lipoprotein GldB [Chryseobacterium balustinum]